MTNQQIADFIDKTLMKAAHPTPGMTQRQADDLKNRVFADAPSFFYEVLGQIRHEGDHRSCGRTYLINLDLRQRIYDKLVKIATETLENMNYPTQA